MRPHTPRRSRPLTGALTLLMSALLAAAVGPVACAGKTGPDGAPPPARRNGMEAPPPFPSAPDFTVADAKGVQQTLDGLMGAKGLVLVLYRGHW